MWAKIWCTSVVKFNGGISVAELQLWTSYMAELPSSTAYSTNDEKIFLFRQRANGLNVRMTASIYKMCRKDHSF